METRTIISLKGNLCFWAPLSFCLFVTQRPYESNAAFCLSLHSNVFIKKNDMVNLLLGTYSNKMIAYVCLKVVYFLEIFCTETDMLFVQYGVKIFLITSFKDTCYMEIIPRIQKSNRGTLLSAFTFHWASVWSPVWKFAVLFLFFQPPSCDEHGT